MRYDASNQVNYWPAYVDALINVVLNLLFLVGVFTIALVSLNAQALFAEQEANRRKLAALDAAKTQRERQQLVSELLFHIPAESHVSQRQVKTKESQLNFEQPRILEIRLKSDVNQSREIGQKQLTDQDEKKSMNSLELFITQQSNGGDIKGIAFDLNQYEQPINAADLSKLQDRASQKAWFLLVISDPRNPRLSREAYARLLTVRSALIKAGALPASIQLKVTNAPDVVIYHEGIERTVWVTEKNL